MKDPIKKREGNKRRQYSRQSLLDKFARAAGFPSWSSFETEVLHKRIKLSGEAAPRSKPRKRDPEIDRFIRRHHKGCGIHLLVGRCTCGRDKTIEWIKKLSGE